MPSTKLAQMVLLHLIKDARAKGRKFLNITYNYIIYVGYAVCLSPFSFTA